MRRGWRAVLALAAAAVLAVETRAQTPSRSGARTATSSQTPSAAGRQLPGATRQLLGSYLRIGVNSVGTLGSGGNTPPGIQVDYSGSGVFRDQYDFLTPGSPYEGWSVKWQTAPGVSTIHTNNNQGPNSVAGVLYIYSGQEYRDEVWDHRAVWVGTTAAYTIHHDVRFNQDDDIISILTDITARTLLPRAFFARFVDPDARVSSADSSDTRNVRGWGPIPPSNIVLSEALVSGYTQGLMSAQQGGVGTGITSPWSADPEDYAVGSPGNPVGDDVIGIGFSLGNVTAGRTVQLSYYYVFSSAQQLATTPRVFLEPSRGSLLGGTLVVVTPGLLLSPAGALRCRWGASVASDRSATVPATYSSNATATCAAPLSLKLGPAPVFFSATGGATWVFIGVYTYVASDAGGLPSLLLRPGGPDSSSVDGGPLLWPSTTTSSPTQPMVSLAISWLLSDRELFAVSSGTLAYTLELLEVTDPLGTAEAWLGASGPRFQGAPLPPVTPAVQAALAAAELAAHVATLTNGTLVSPSAARLVGAVTTPPLGFGMTTDASAGSDGLELAAFLAVPVPLNASVRSPLAVRAVFVRLTARSGMQPLLVRTSTLRWLLPGPPPPVATPAPPCGAAASRSASASATPRASQPVEFDARTACAAWKALQLDRAAWSGRLPQCPQSLAQLSRSQWAPANECPGLNGSLVVMSTGVEPCWAHRGRVAFGEADARSCFVSAVASATHAAASCCYDADGRLLRTGASSASDARFAPYPAPLSHVFAHQLPHLVCCRLASGQGDCDGTARTTGNSSWRGAGGAAGAPYFVTLDGATLAFNGAGDFVFLGVKTAPSVATPRIASLPATPGRLWGALPAGVSFLSLVRLLPLSLLYPAGSPSASVIQGWAAVTAAGEHVSVTVRGGQLQVHVNGTMLPLWTESGFLDIFTAGSTFARTRSGLVALARTARFGAGNGTAAAAAAGAAREALASGALDSSAADVTYTVGNVTVVFSRAQRRVRVLLPHVGVAVTVSQVRSVVAALDGALLHVAADVAPAGWNRTFGLLGNFDGVTANDVRTHGEPPLSAVNTALKVAAPNAAFVDDLPTLPSPYTPVFSAALRDPGAVGVDIVLLNACGIAANVTGSSGALPFAQSACYLYGSVTDTADIAAATLQLARELEQAAAAARGPAPEFVNPPDSFALVEGRVHNITLSASVPVFLPGRPAEAVSYRVQSTPSGACSIGERSGVLVCGPLAISAAGLTPAANGCNATGVIVVTASSRVTSATTHHRLMLEVAAGLTGSASWSPSLSGSASAATSNTASGSTTSSVSSSAASTSSGTVTASATASRSATLSGSGSATSSGTVTASATASRSATLSGSRSEEHTSELQSR